MSELMPILYWLSASAFLVAMVVCGEHLLFDLSTRPRRPLCVSISGTLTAFCAAGVVVSLMLLAKSCPP